MDKDKLSKRNTVSASGKLEVIHRPYWRALENDDPEAGEEPQSTDCRHTPGRTTEVRRGENPAVEAQNRNLDGRNCYGEKGFANP